MKDTHISTRKALILALVAGCAGAMMMSVMQFGFEAYADTNRANDEVPRLIPYNGVLEFDGTPITATGADAVWLRFDITDDVDGGTIVYSQDVQVNVYNGNFSALLGPTGTSGTSLEAVVAYSTELSLTLTVVTTPGDASGDVELSNAQKLAITPFAMWSTNASSFDVADVLTVGSNVVVDSNATSTEARARIAQFTLDSSQGEGLVSLVAGAEVDGPNSGHNYLGTRGASKIRMGDGNIRFFGGGTAGTSGSDVTWTETLDLDSSGNTTVKGNLTVDGTSSLKGATSVTGTLSSTGALSGSSVAASGAISGASLSTTGNTSVGGTLGVTGATTTNAMTVNGQLSIQDIATSGSDGCMRIGTIQHCWGEIMGDGSDSDVDAANFVKAFGTAPRVTITSSQTGTNNLRGCHIRGLSTTHVSTKCYNSSSDNRDGDAHYLAIGSAGADW